MANTDENDRPAGSDNRQAQDKQNDQASITNSHREDVLAQIRQRFKLTDH